jgi:hypothetical protein
MADVAWVHGTAIAPPTPPEVPGLGDGTVAAVLGEAESIINSMGAQIAQEWEQEKTKKRRWWRRKK